MLLQNDKRQQIVVQIKTYVELLVIYRAQKLQAARQEFFFLRSEEGMFWHLSVSLITSLRRGSQKSGFGRVSVETAKKKSPPKKNHQSIQNTFGHYFTIR